MESNNSVIRYQHIGHRTCILRKSWILMPKRTNTPLIGISLLLALLYAYSLFGVTDRFSLTPFREAHTAISSYYMAKGESSFLAYQVPVLGKPWTVPMEFPLFQWIAAKLGGTNIHTLRWTGRLLSLTFWGGCLYMAFLISLRAPLEKNDRLWLLALLAAAPIFSAYSTTFLIESFALFFALGYLWSFLCLQAHISLGILVLTCTFGVLTSLSKPSTWASFAGVIIMAACLDMLIGLKNKDDVKRIFVKLLISAITITVPLMAVLIWVNFCDTVKMENPLTRKLTSEGLSNWAYGSLSQKLSPFVWSVILIKQWLLLFGVAAVLVPFVLLGTGWSAFKEKTVTAPLLWLLIALGGYFSAPVIFTNLHFHHDYYLFANGFFLIAAFVLSMSHLRRKFSAKIISWVYCLTVVSSILVGFGYTGLRMSLTEPVEDALIVEIQQLKIDGPIVYFGFDWSSKLPYELERRALMLNMRDPKNPDYIEAMKLNQNLHWAAIVVGDSGYEAIAAETARSLGGGFDYEKEFWPGMWLKSRAPLAEKNAAFNGINILDRVAERLDDVEIPASPGGLVYLHSWFTPSPKGESPFELILRRRGDVFFLDGKELKLFRFRNYFKVKKDIQSAASQGQQPT